MFSSRATKFTTLLAGLFLAFSMVAVDDADARRGGSFGSRGTRTFQSAPPTRTAPRETAPVERSMAPRENPGAAARQPGALQRTGIGNGFGGSLMRGLFLGGLIGLLFGAGFGGLAGAFGMLLQLLLIGGLALLAIRFFASQRTPVPAGGPSRFGRDWMSGDAGMSRGASPGSSAPPVGSAYPGRQPQPAAPEEIGLDQADLDRFEQLLAEVQAAFSGEDHAALRRIATPEMVSFLSEELAENAMKSVRNEVSDVRLLQADIAESWREGDRDYATAAMLYESRDVTRDRNTGSVVDGTPDAVTETTELWTFVRERGGEWRLSAIQEA